jgi:AraC-like DNA-binding protein
MLQNMEGDFGKVRVISHLPTQTARSVYNFTTSAGWHLCNDSYRVCREEGLDSFLIFFTLHGCGQLHMNNVLLHLSENTTAIIPPGLAHEYFVAPGDRWEFYWLDANGLSAAQILRHLVSTCGFLFPSGAHAGDICREIEDLLFYKSTANPAFEVHASDLISSILHQLMIGMQETENSNINEKAAVKQLLKYLETNYCDKISIQELSESWFISSAHLSRLFKVKTGYTPYEYLLHYRIMKSKELLLYTDLNLVEIARRTGFRYASNYICQFKARESSTPDQFRNSCRKGAVQVVPHDQW